MITKDNLKAVLKILGFTKQDKKQEHKKADSTKQELYTKTLHAHYAGRFYKAKAYLPQSFAYSKAVTGFFSQDSKARKENLSMPLRQ